MVARVARKAARAVAADGRFQLAVTFDLPQGADVSLGLPVVRDGETVGTVTAVSQTTDGVIVTVCAVGETREDVWPLALACDAATGGRVRVIVEAAAVQMMRVARAVGE